MKSQGDLEQEQWRSYSFLCSAKRKKETHQETRLWSTGSLTLADKKADVRLVQMQLKVNQAWNNKKSYSDETREPEPVFSCRNGVLTSLNLFLIFLFEIKLL